MIGDGDHEVRDGSLRWSWREVAVALFVSGWIAIQVIVPTVGLMLERPQRVSWQMFSGLSRHPTFVLVLDDGTEDSRRVGQLLPRVRADVVYEQDLPPYLCATREGLVEVRMEWDERTAVHRCGP